VLQPLEHGRAQQACLGELLDLEQVGIDVMTDGSQPKKYPPIA
jgi:hypothetical protein